MHGTCKRELAVLLNIALYRAFSASKNTAEAKIGSMAVMITV
jgi:hypothetical protein